MKAESGVRPNRFSIDKVGDAAIVSLFDNIEEVEPKEEEEAVYKYDYYSVEVPYRDDLEAEVEESYEEWLEMAKGKDKMPEALDLEDRIQAAENTLLFLLMGGI